MFYSIASSLPDVNVSEILVGHIWYTILTSYTVRTGRLDNTKIHNALENFNESDPQEITIPETIFNGTLFTVVEIGNHSFSQAHNYQIHLPQTITQIDSFAFDLVLMDTFPNLTSLKKIGFLAFGSNCFEEIHLPNTIEVIDDAAFAYSFVDDMKIYLPEGSKFFCVDEQGALYNFRKTRIIWAPKREKFVIPLTVQYIPEHLFYQSTASTIVIPPSCSSLGFRSFINCYNLTKIIITGNIFEINPDFISDVPNLKIIDYHGTTRIPAVNSNNLTIYLCTEYKWNKAFGIIGIKQDKCPSINIIHYPTCETTFYSSIIYQHVIVAIFLS